MPALAGADHAFIVLSGSMQPLLAPGDVVFVRDVDPATLRVGEAITFRAAPGSEMLITHRIIEVLDDGGRVRYRTQGDANEDPDPFVVHPAMVVGSYAFHLPWWGLAITAVRSGPMLLVVVVLPAIAVLAHEGRHLARLLAEEARTPP